MRAYIGIGSNIERDANVRAAVQTLRKRFGRVTFSGVYESQPIGFEGENFYNLVAVFDTDESPEAIVAILHDIERQLGRKRGTPRFAPRTIDLDLLLYGDLVRDDLVLRVPRPEVTEYACVLRPLTELAPEARHPRNGETFANLWARFDKAAQPLSPVALELTD
jgi:2-amino-4-hydroxy-6-hydroxymethyldihydropteridine diphosphokinase